MKFVYLAAAVSAFAVGLFFWSRQGGEEGSTPPAIAAAATSEDLTAGKKVREQVPEEYRLLTRTPVDPNPASLRNGEMLFSRFCSSCHGVRGQGNGPAAAGLIRV